MKTVLKIAGFAVLTIVTSLALGLSWISFQGRRDLAAIRADLLGRGEKLSLTELAPPPIPDEQNFFAEPLWQPSADGATIKQLSGLLKAAASSAEVAALKRQFPQFAGLDFSTSRDALARAAWKKSPDPEGAHFVLAVMEPLDPTLARISELLARPGARFPIVYEQLFSAQVPHLSPLLTLGKLLQFRARARLALGETAAAQQDILALSRLADTVATEPLLISLLVRISLKNMCLPPLAAGLSTHAWSDAQLLELQRAFEAVDLPAALAAAFRGERGGFNGFFEMLRRKNRSATELIATALNEQSSNGSQPPGWQSPLLPAGTTAYLAVCGPGDQAFYNRRISLILDALDRAPTAGLRADRFLADAGTELYWPGGVFRVFSMISLPAITVTISKVAATQDRLTMAAVACAIERYRLTNGEYPTTLADLVPRFLPAVPRDIFDRAPLSYARDASGTFTLAAHGKPWSE